MNKILFVFLAITAVAVVAVCIAVPMRMAVNRQRDTIKGNATAKAGAVKASNDSAATGKVNNTDVAQRCATTSTGQHYTFARPVTSIMTFNVKGGQISPHSTCSLALALTLRGTVLDYVDVTPTRN